jgi:hypothetical protein
MNREARKKPVRNMSRINEHCPLFSFQGHKWRIGTRSEYDGHLVVAVSVVGIDRFPNLESDFLFLKTPIIKQRLSLKTRNRMHKAG